jgi:hypothetical protein
MEHTQETPKKTYQQPTLENHETLVEVTEGMMVITTTPL